MVWMRVVWEVVMLLRTDNRCETVLGWEGWFGGEKKIYVRGQRGTWQWQQRIARLLQWSLAYFVAGHGPIS